MDHLSFRLQGLLTVTILSCLNYLEVCSCKPIKASSNNKLNLVPCVLELFVLKESKTDTTKTYNDIEKTVELLKDQTLWKKSLSDKETDCSISILWYVASLSPYLFLSHLHF